jgi:hypothetical protein
LSIYQRKWLFGSILDSRESKNNIQTLSYQKKATKGKPLTDSEKEENKVISSFRVVVEHALSGIKRFGILSQTLRNRKAFFDDIIMEIGCGLWNFHLKVA